MRNAFRPFSYNVLRFVALPAFPSCAQIFFFPTAKRAKAKATNPVRDCNKFTNSWTGVSPKMQLHTRQTNNSTSPCQKGTGFPRMKAPADYGRPVKTRRQTRIEKLS